MLRSRKFTALICALILTTGCLLLGGCGVQVNRGGEGGGGDGPGNSFKPGPADFQGDTLAFGGHWKGRCEAIVNGTSRTDCSMEMDVKQESMLMDGTITLSGTITIFNTSRDFHVPVYGINRNDLQIMGGGFGGNIGSGAFRIYEDQFRGFSAKALGKDKSGKIATRIGVLATQLLGGFSFVSSSSSSCGKSNCFAADLVLQPRSLF